MIRAIGLLGGGSQADETAEFDPQSAVVFRAVSADRLAQAGEGFIDIATDDPRLLGTPVVAAGNLPERPPVILLPPIFIPPTESDDGRRQ